MPRENTTIGKNIVAIGGGSGLHTVLEGLQRHVGEEISRLSALISLRESEGEKVVRDKRGNLPPGDLLLSLSALCPDNELSLSLRRLFFYRLDHVPELSRYMLGNLFLVALRDVQGGRVDQAIEVASRLFNVRGEIVPLTLSDSFLRVDTRERATSWGENEGELHVDIVGHRLALDPPAAIYPTAESRIAEADAIVIGPGDLRFDIIPNLLVTGVAEALARSPAQKIFVCNLMNKAGETDGFRASDHLRAVSSYLPALRFDHVLVGQEDYPPDLLARYREVRAEPVEVDTDACLQFAASVSALPLASTEVLLRHDPLKLGNAIIATLVGVPARS